MFDACTEEPELAWLAISKILERPLSDDQRALLAADPLETLLASHGKMFIDRVEKKQRKTRNLMIFSAVFGSRICQLKSGIVLRRPGKEFGE
jgi:hypothetical protein